MRSGDTRVCNDTREPQTQGAASSRCDAAFDENSVPSLDKGGLQGGLVPRSAFENLDNPLKAQRLLSFRLLSPLLRGIFQGADMTAMVFNLMASNKSRSYFPDGCSGVVALEEQRTGFGSSALTVAANRTSFFH